MGPWRKKKSLRNCHLNALLWSTKDFPWQLLKTKCASSQTVTEFTQPADIPIILSSNMLSDRHTGQSDIYSPFFLHQQAGRKHNSTWVQFSHFYIHTFTNDVKTEQTLTKWAAVKDERCDTWKVQSVLIDLYSCNRPRIRHVLHQSPCQRCYQEWQHSTDIMQTSR